VSGGRIESLLVMAEPAQQEGRAERQQQIGENGSDQCRSHHVQIACLQGGQADDQLRRVAERRVQQPTHRITRPRRQLLGRAHDQGRDRHDGQRG
jgi:hypothetical protein